MPMAVALREGEIATALHVLLARADRLFEPHNDDVLSRTNLASFGELQLQRLSVGDESYVVPAGRCQRRRD
jgi:hypothetical protein